MIQQHILFQGSHVKLLFKWCCICSDFGKQLVLCAGCRVSICLSDIEVGSVCINWDPIVEDSGFIFYCPFCESRGMGKSVVSPVKMELIEPWADVSFSLQCAPLFRIFSQLHIVTTLLFSSSLPHGPRQNILLVNTFTTCWQSGTTMPLHL